MKEKEKIYEAIRLMSDMDMSVNAARAKALLQEFIIANDTPRKSGKVDIWKFVDNPKKSVRPVMTGVCYIPSMKIAVATDSLAMLISKPDYVEREVNNGVRINGASEPCGIYRKDGTGVTKEYQSSDYPNFLSVVPDGKEQEPAQMNDKDVVVRAVKEAKIAIKAKTASLAMIQVTKGVWMRLEHAELMLTMPEWKFTCDKERRNYKPMIYRDENYTALFMPMMPHEDSDDNNILYLGEN